MIQPEQSPQQALTEYRQKRAETFEEEFRKFKIADEIPVEDDFLKRPKLDAENYNLFERMIFRDVLNQRPSVEWNLEQFLVDAARKELARHLLEKLKP